MNKPNLKVALLGYGLGGSAFHAPLIATTKGLELKAIVTSNPERSAKAKADYPQAAILAKAEEIWNNPKDFDLVVITTPNKLHIPLAEKALNSGLSVVIDKPFATSVKEAEHIIGVGKNSDKLLTVFQNRRWDNDFLTLRKLIKEGRLGNIRRLESRYERFRPELNKNAWREAGSTDDAGGLLFDLGSHLIDQAVALFGKPKTVYAELPQRREGARVDDDSFVALTFKDGTIAHLWMSLTARAQGKRYLVNGTLGSYEKHGLDPQENILRAGHRPGEDNGDWGKEPESLWGTLSYEKDGKTVSERIESVPGDYPGFYREVFHSIMDGDKPPVDLAEALTTMQVIEAAQKSAKDQTVVSFS